MKYTVLLFACLIAGSVFGQKATSIPANEFVVHAYDELLGDSVDVYQYSGKWDIDGDKIHDTIEFVGNNGAHCYYHLKIRLSSGQAWQEFSTLEVDMPYFKQGEELNESSFLPKMMIKDFDNDGIDEIFMNLDYVKISFSPSNHKHIETSHIIVDFSNQRLHIEPYEVFAQH